MAPRYSQNTIFNDVRPPSWICKISTFWQILDLGTYNVCIGLPKFIYVGLSKLAVSGHWCLTVTSLTLQRVTLQAVERSRTTVESRSNLSCNHCLTKLSQDDKLPRLHAARWLRSYVAAKRHSENTCEMNWIHRTSIEVRWTLLQLRWSGCLELDHYLTASSSSGTLVDLNSFSSLIYFILFFDILLAPLDNF